MESSGKNAAFRPFGTACLMSIKPKGPAPVKLNADQK